MLVRIKYACEVNSVKYAPSRMPQNIDPSAALNIVNNGKGFLIEEKKAPKKEAPKAKVYTRPELNAMAKEKEINSFGLSTEELKKQLGL